MSVPLIWCQQWEESERGWGTRPDGYTLHMTKQDAKDFAQRFMDSQRQSFEDRGIDGVPDEYTRPCGEPYEILPTHEQYRKLQSKTGKENQGLWFQERAPDGGGPGTWRREEHTYRLPRPAKR